MSQQKTKPPKPHIWGRIADYIAIQFPPLTALPILGRFLLPYLSIQLWLGGPVNLSVRGLFAAGTVVVLTLLQRVFDELKDVDTDLRLAAAGDPKYQSRPIVTGQITKEDLVTLRWFVTGLAFVLALPLGIYIATFIILYTAIWLSFKWFFYPPIKDNLLLALATHSPLSVVYSAYGIILGWAELSPNDSARSLFLGIILITVVGWMPMLSWELSRKIRAPGYETSYETYSKVLGYKLAAILPILSLVCGFVSLALLWMYTPLPIWIVLLASLASAGAILRCLNFLLKPTPKNAKLEPFTLLSGGVVFIGVPIAIWVSG